MIKILKNLFPTTITSYLPFSNDIIQFIDVRGWDGQSIMINREFYLNLIRGRLETDKIPKINEEIIERTENVDGIYILFGEDLEDINPLNEGVVYIGSTGNFKQRMTTYFRNEEESDVDFCSKIIFFSRKNKLGGAGLGESLRKAIESQIIKLSKKVKRYRILNIQEDYHGRINLSDQDLLEDFIKRIKIILANMGVSLLKEKIAVVENDTKNYFICVERNANAVMYRGDTGYVVLKDSIIIKDNLERLTRHYKKIVERKMQLLEEDILKPSEDIGKLILKENQEFNSPSGAAAFVSGGTYNGNVVWKKKDDQNITLGEFLQSISESNS